MKKASPLEPTTAEAVKTISNEQMVKTLFDQSYTAPGSVGLHQISAYAETAKVYDNGRGIRNGVVFGNSAAFDPKEFPSGHVINFNPAAHVDPITLSADSFQHMVLCKVIPGAEKKQIPDDEYFKARLAAIDAASPQYSTAPVNASICDERNMDDDHWQAEMGKNGAYGVLRCRRGTRSNDYYIYARCSSEILANDVIKQVADAKAAGTPMTWDNFLRSKSLIFWKNAVTRSSCRIAHALAAKLDVAIETMAEDGTYSVDDNQADRVTALPTHQQFISQLAFSYQNGNKYATQYSQCAPPSVGTVGRNNYHFVSVSPYHGLVGVRLTEGYKPISGALPTTTGRKVNASKVVGTHVDPDDVEAISSQYTWEGKPEGRLLDPKTINDRLHPDAYRTFDDAFINSNFVAQGWKKESGTEPFDPVIMKVATRKARPL